MSTRRSQDVFFQELFDLLRLEGIADLTVAELAKRLRCSRSRLYAIAETKEELFLLMAKRYLGLLLEESKAVEAAGGDIVPAIRRYLDIGVRASAQLGVPFLRDLDATRQGRRLFDSYQAKRGQGLARLVEQGVAQGMFNPRHAELVAEILMGGALRIRRTRFLARTGLTLEEAFAEFYALLLHGLMKNAEGSGQPAQKHWKGDAVPAAAPSPAAADTADAEAAEPSDITELLLKASIRH
ncbi:TetR/AcrR family transcriptional regulator [Comamonas composti]|uniref:TetR/AcrR family transcriptional regulator n=1 Tax=Comamonas composti TaxID=408558 RepID=UPI00040616E2|nr:TetR/AcrR family transcriptional regulator [Comamonas composti]